MTRTVLAGFSVVLLVVLRFQAAPPDLSGVWRPDAAASKAEKVLKAQTDSTVGKAPPPPPPAGPIHPTERIEQKDGTIQITSLDEAGEVLNVLAFLPGGEEKLNPLAGGKVMHKSRARWVGAELHVEWSMEREGQKFIWGSDVRSLQDSATQRLERHVEDGKSWSHLVVVLRRVRSGP